MKSMEDSEALDTDASEAVSSADELIPDTIEDGASSTKDEETIDGVGNGVEVSEDVNGSTEAGTVEEARSPSWDNGGGVLDTEEASAESDSVAMGAAPEDDESRMADSETGEGSAGDAVEVSSSRAGDVDEERSELDVSDKEAVMFGVVASLALMVGPIDTGG
jgi:hypothetical protein